MSEKVAKTYCLLAEFPSAAALYEAAEKVRDEGFRRWDVFSPFPIHGMDQAMGLGKSNLSWLIFFGGLTGFIIAVLLQSIPSAVLYPLIVQGKPYLSWPAFFPILFELTILLSAFTTVFGLCGVLGLPRLHHPLFNNKDFERVSDDAFFMAIEARDPKFSESGTRELLESIGGHNITIVEDK